MDVRHYFPSIDHDLLKEKLRRRLKDHGVLDLLDRIIDGSPTLASETCYFPGDDLFTPLARRVGIPIGNLTSQFFANLYLDDLDHFIKQELQIRPYLRYVDDMVVLGHDKGRLAEIRTAVRDRLAVDRLRLHPHKAHITRVADGLNLLGYLVFPTRRRLRNDNGHRFARKLRGMARAFGAGRLKWARVVASTQSWIGHAQHADTEGLRRGIFSPGCVHKGSGPRDGQRVIRGGSWNNKPENLRSSNRNRNNTDNRNNNIGFRLAQSARTAHSRPRAILFMDRVGAAAGVHEPASRPPAQAGTPNREPGVRQTGAGGLFCRPRPLRGCLMSFFFLSFRQVVGRFATQDDGSPTRRYKSEIHSVGPFV